MTGVNAESVRKSLEPFAEIGLLYTKADESDTSVWTTVPDDKNIPVGGQWSVTVGELRAAYEEYKAWGGDFD